jgi:tRNA 2-thiouridine synthesizing protein C
MHRSAWHGLSFLSSAIGERLSAELYAYLDGIHLGHHDQRPTDAENISEGLTALSEKAAAAGLGFQALACSRSATARGYSTWDDGQGSVISTCTIKPFKIRELDQLIERFRQTHTILSSDAGSLHLRKQSASSSFDRAQKNNTAPPVTILVTQSPYSTELASGAVAFASACAHAGILARVVFMEDGVYALTGTHRVPANSEVFNLQEVINAVAGSENLHFFAFTPSFQKRGITKDKSLNAVLDIGYPGLGKIFFYPPGNIQAGHQRLLVF